MFLALSSDGNCAKSIDRCLLYEERFQRMGIRSYNALEKKRKGKNMPSSQALEAVEANVPSNFEMASPPPQPQPEPQPEPISQPIDPPVTIEPIAALENASPEMLRELLHTDWAAFFKNSGKILSFVVLCLFLLALKLSEAARAAGVR